MSLSRTNWLFTALLAFAMSGCGGDKGSTSDGGSGSGSVDAGEVPSFTLAWSEYPSWSAFDVAHRHGIINGEKGKLGPVEQKWKVDIELKYADYDPCINMYASSQCDAVCITNIDVMAQAVSRPSVAILPTSTSAGADACIVVGVANPQELRNHKVYGLEKSVSQYAFERCLEKLGEDPAAHQFTQMDPGNAALAMQQANADYQAIMVWNPFVLDTLRKRAESKVLFDSKQIPGEIIDMVVIGQDSLAKPGGENFCCAVIDAYYEINEVIEHPETRDKALVQIGEKFSNLGLEDMKKVVEQTKFYKTSEEGLAVFTGAELPKTMEIVAAFCKAHEMPKDGAPTVGYGLEKEGENFNLRFDPMFINRVQSSGGAAKTD